MVVVLYNIPVIISGCSYCDSKKNVQGDGLSCNARAAPIQSQVCWGALSIAKLHRRVPIVNTQTENITFPHTLCVGHNKTNLIQVKTHTTNIFTNTHAKAVSDLLS